LGAPRPDASLNGPLRPAVIGYGDPSYSCGGLARGPHPLSRIIPKQAVPALIALLQMDPDPKVREAAAYGLGSALNGRKQVTEALLQTLGDQAEDPEVRAQAAEALGDLWEPVGRRPPPFIDDLVAVLEEPSAEIRFWAAFALSKLGDERIVPALEHLAGSDDRIVPHWWSVKHEAIMGIARILQRRPGRMHAPARKMEVLYVGSGSVMIVQSNGQVELLWMSSFDHATRTTILRSFLSPIV